MRLVLSMIAAVSLSACCSTHQTAGYPHQAPLWARVWFLPC